ncbi:hypothetical protein [Shewanella dokdonensis]|uniref:Lipoprotein n=1 Tax=Shewanella dokdonensis TaxID=712036 RepID=A0ABX8DH04_9GAMM|nr:hypothetical protein [Shewanella dokdonensis]MCL1073010.1 hypothetical protein [Shewanella dokdonensis]QVK23077.1 hypothetical protein KHX94_18575 [Shewanella dokdonensis]
MNIKGFFIVSTLVLAVAGCTNTPPEAPELSIELGNHLQVLEASHKALLQQFFNNKREQIDIFMHEQWLPEFANTFFSKPAIAKAWDTIVSENNKADRLKFLLHVAPQVQEALNQQRQQLLKPVNELESKLLSALDAEYTQAYAINNTITSFLTSASQITENRNRYLKMITGDDGKYADYLNKVDAAVAKLTQYADDASKYEAKATEFMDEINALKGKF